MIQRTPENASASRGSDVALSDSLNQPSTQTAIGKATESDNVMGTARLEAFSDGVIAVIITIMVLELKAPTNPAISELVARWHIFAAYAASFVFVAIFWVNHHYMTDEAEQVP